ncbi:unnamed protein product, partial [Urochloa humidicola]
HFLAAAAFSSVSDEPSQKPAKGTGDEACCLEGVKM